MAAGFLELDFSTVIKIVVWCLLPVYGSFLGLTLPFLAKAPSLAASSKLCGEGGFAIASYRTQLLFFFCSLLVMTSYRGHEGSLCQGQLVLTQINVKLLFLILTGLGAALGFSIVVGSAGFRSGALGFSTWHLGPTLATLWGLLPLSTQLTTSLLILELIGVALIWALSSSTSVSAPGLHRASTAAPSLIYALVVFVWASGISALGLLIGLGLTGLEGGVLNFLGSKGLSYPEASRPSVGFVEVLFLVVLTFKFLMGGGQFLLLTWYRFLPPNGLAFYLLFYYPAHLLIGTTFFIGFFSAKAALAILALVFMLVIAALALVPHLGAQASPSLTLAGSSFVGLSFLAVAALNLVS